ncbi:MAG: DUF4340 domain-containing protein [Deltaproteobacteria bacterium]|nr:DUF4340 domain-containing protein [Deltaproteobacteria bacterium]
MKRIGRTAIGAFVVAMLGAAVAWKAIADFNDDKINREAARKRERLYGGWGRAHVVTFDLFTGGISYEIVKDDAGAWVLESPIRWSADQEAVAAAIDAMVSVAAVDVVAEAVTEAVKAQYGLDKPQTVARAKLADGTTHELRVGLRNNAAQCFNVSIDEVERIYCARESFYQDISRDLYAYRDKQLIRMAPAEVVSIAVSKGSQLAFALERADSGWTVKSVSEAIRPADPLIVDSFLRILTKDLKAESFATDSVDTDTAESTKRYGLEPPAFTLVVRATNGKETTAFVGPAAGDGREPRGPFFRLADTTFVASVYDAFPNDLDKSFADFRDRTIARFDMNDVHRAELWLQSGQKVSIEREVASPNAKESTWRMVSPTNRQAKPWKIQAILSYFSTLRSSRVATDAATPEQLRGWLLEPPDRRATFYDQAGRRLADVRIGKPIDGSHVYITAEGLGRVDGIQDNTLAKVLPARLDELVGEE